MPLAPPRVIDRTLAYTLRGVGALLAVVGLLGVVYLVANHGSGYNIGYTTVQLGDGYYAGVFVFGLLALIGSAMFFLGLHRLAEPGSLAFRLTRFRL